ncbi:Uncharacterized protein TCM_043727 [Theobroma cacao]|uniref:Uncharacterized protein n=1 Tax=Theobroma cacao TaxID=3641 RepID=A0A061FW66_THECC|nr:Uncharacterized protein TCM_043727 [Theobroma cacao]
MLKQPTESQITLEVKSQIMLNAEATSRESKSSSKYTQRMATKSCRRESQARHKPLSLLTTILVGTECSRRDEDST